MPQKKLKILVVDDEEGLLELTQKILRFKCGYETIGTMDGEEAVKLYIEHKPDICLLDVHLDDSLLHGNDVLREVKKINPQAVCIMVSRITEEKSIVEAKKFGATAYLFKPMDTQELLALVKKVADSNFPGGA